MGVLAADELQNIAKYYCRLISRSTLVNNKDKKIVLTYFYRKYSNYYKLECKAKGY